MLFVGYLISNNRKSTTIKSYISAIRAVLRDDGETLNENMYLIASLTKACKFKNDTVGTRLPIRKYVLRMLVDNLHKIFLPQGQQPYLVTLYKALFMTAYFGLFRVRELTYTDSKHMLKAKDVHIGKKKKKMMFVLRTSKTHWHDQKPQVIKSSEKSSVTATTRPYTIHESRIQIRSMRRSSSKKYFN